MLFMLFIPFIILAIPLLFYYSLLIATKSKIISPADVPYSKYTLVLGAGLERNGEPSDILKDRVRTAVKLLKNGKTKILILSGAKNSYGFCEPESMKRLAESLGVRNEDLILDTKGRSTYYSCKFLKEMNIKKDVIIISQKFHLTRAIWLAKSFGIEAIGTPANLYKFSIYNLSWWTFREIYALPFNLIRILFDY